MKKYRWVAESNDRSFEDESRQEFTSKEECYNDMRNAALEKMKWNTEFTDCDENDTLGYKVHFSQNKIIHESYSGVYTYEIKEVQEMKTIELTEDQIKMIANALKTNIRVNQEAAERMYNVCGDNKDTREIAGNILRGNVCIRILLNYIEQV